MAAVLSVLAASLRRQATNSKHIQGLQDKKQCVHISGLAAHPKVVVDRSRCFPLQDNRPCQFTEPAEGSEAHLLLASYWLEFHKPSQTIQTSKGN